MSSLSAQRSSYEWLQGPSLIVRPPLDGRYIPDQTLVGFGPRKVMATLLILGAIPSGLAGTVSTANGLYVVRFFIGILGGTFVACQAWTTAFFDTNVVGTGETCRQVHPVNFLMGQQRTRSRAAGVTLVVDSRSSS
jgi:MFS family permease